VSDRRKRDPLSAGELEDAAVFLRHAEHVLLAAAKGRAINPGDAKVLREACRRVGAVLGALKAAAA
jgi:hypothetical protein